MSLALLVSDAGGLKLVRLLSLVNCPREITLALKIDRHLRRRDLGVVRASNQLVVGSLAGVHHDTGMLPFPFVSGHLRLPEPVHGRSLTVSLHLILLPARRLSSRRVDRGPIVLRVERLEVVARGRRVRTVGQRGVIVAGRNEDPILSSLTISLTLKHTLALYGIGRLLSIECPLEHVASIAAFHRVDVRPSLHRTPQRIS